MYMYAPSGLWMTNFSINGFSGWASCLSWWFSQWVDDLFCITQELCMSSRLQDTMEAWWWRPLPNPNKLFKYEGPSPISFLSFFHCAALTPWSHFLNFCRLLKLSLLLSHWLFLLLISDSFPESLLDIVFLSHPVLPPELSAHLSQPLLLCLRSLRKSWKVELAEELQPGRYFWLLYGAYTQSR